MRSIKIAVLFLVVGCFLTTLSAPSVLATDWYSTEYGGYWDYPSTWKDSAGNPPPDGEPGEGDSAFLVVPYMYSSPSSPIPTYVDYRSDTSPLLNQVIVESSTVLSQWQYPYGGGTPAVEQLYLRSNVERIGGSGLTFDPPPPEFGGPLPEIFPIGSHRQNAGTNSTGGLYIGGTEGSYGQYYLDNASDSIYGTLSVESLEIIGSAGEGLFEQDGGVHEVGTALIMGMSETGTGTYQMTDGTLDAAVEIVGSSGYGEFNQSGGENTANQLVLGQNSGGEGFYNLSGTGTLNVGTGIIGASGKGSFVQDGGTHNADALILASEDSGFTGKYELNNGVLNAGSETIGDAGRGAFDQNGGEHLANSMVVAAQNSGLRSSYTLDGGTLDVVQTTTVGASGDASFYQSTGTRFTTGNLKIADGSTSESFYQLDGGELQVGNELTIGSQGKGDFYHYGGNVEIGADIFGKLTLATENDTYNLSIGSLTVHGHEDISGTFVQRTDSFHTVTEGTAFLANGINIGTSSGGNGEYKMVGGTLSSPYIVVGAGGSAQGVFEQTGPTSTVTTTYLDVGVSQPRSGLMNTYNLVDGLLTVGSVSNHGEVKVGLNAETDSFDSIQLDGGKLWVIGDEKIGIAGWGVLGQSDGEHQVDGTLNVGHEAVGYYVMSGGDLTVNGNENVGYGAEGSFSQTGGDHTINSGSLTIGAAADGVGSYYLGEVSGATNPKLTVNGNERIGNYGEGEFYHYRGLHTVNGELILGGEDGGTGTYTQTGGSLIVNDKETIGYDGIGTFNQSGGKHSVNSALYVGLRYATASGGTGTYNLSGVGELYADTFELAYGKDSDGTFSQSGGTAVFGRLKAGGSVSYFGAKATINLDSGTLIVNGTEAIGVHGKATVNHTGGTNTAIKFELGFQEGANAKYNLSGSGDVHVNTMFINDFGNYGGRERVLEWGRGRFVQDGVGTRVEIDNKLYISPGIITTGYLLRKGVLINSGVELDGLNEKYGVIAGVMFPDTYLNSTFTQTGGRHVVNGDIIINRGGYDYTLPYVYYGYGGRYSISGGSLTADTVYVAGNQGNFAHNHGTFSVNTDDADVHVTVEDNTFRNEGLTTFDGAGTATVNGRVENTGEMTTTGTNVVFNGMFINSGQFGSQNSNVQFDQLVVEPTGYMTGNGGDMFSVSGDFMNGSLETTLWETSETSLIFNGSGVQNFYLAGVDLGATALGFEDNFAWGELILGSGVNLNLLDGNDVAGAALYIGQLGFEDPIVDLYDLIFGSFMSDFNVYYNSSLAGNSFLGGMSYALGGSGFLLPTFFDTPPTEPVPEPSTFVLLGCGLVGLVFMARRKRKEHSS